MLRRLVPAAAAAGLLALTPACGGAEGGPGSDAVKLAPKGTLALIEADSDLESDQWQAAQALLDKFADGDKVFTLLERELGREGLSLEEDVEPALGARVVIVVLAPASGEDEPDVAVLTQPDDRAKLQQLVELEEDEDLELRDVAGWTAIGEPDDLTRYEQALEAGTLEGDDRFEAASSELPEETLASAYIDLAAIVEAFSADVEELREVFGEAEPQWAALSLSAEDDGARFTGAFRVESEDAPDAGSVDDDLLEQVPEDALGVLAFGSNPGLTRQLNVMGLQQFERVAGVDLRRILSAFEEGGVLWVTQGLPIPEVTLVLPGGTVQDVDEVLPLAELGGAQVRDAELDGEPAKRISFGPVGITYAELDDRLVVTTARTFEEPERSLEDSDAFQDARDAAGMPDDTSAFLYLDLARIVPLVTTLAGLSGEDVPAEVERNLEPLRSLLVYGTGEDGTTAFDLFVEIR